MITEILQCVRYMIYLWCLALSWCSGAGPLHLAYPAVETHQPTWGKLADGPACRILKFHLDCRIVIGRISRLAGKPLPLIGIISAKPYDMAMAQKNSKDISHPQLSKFNHTPSIWPMIWPDSYGLWMLVDPLVLPSSIATPLRAATFFSLRFGASLSLSIRPQDGSPCSPWKWWNLKTTIAVSPNATQLWPGSTLHSLGPCSPQGPWWNIVLILHIFPANPFWPFDSCQRVSVQAKNW